MMRNSEICATGTTLSVRLHRVRLEPLTLYMTFERNTSTTSCCVTHDVIMSMYLRACGVYVYVCTFAAAVNSPTKKLCNFLRASNNLQAKGMTALAHLDAMMKYKKEHVDVSL